MGLLSRWADTFKPADQGCNRDIPSADVESAYEASFTSDKAEVQNEDYNYKNATTETKNMNDIENDTSCESNLKRKLDNRHIQFIALGGGIGTGLFIGPGPQLALGGPLTLVIGYIIVGIFLICMVFSLGELASVLPVSGAFSKYASRFIDPAWGFAMGWNYYLQWLIVMPLEFVAAAMVIQFWDPEQKVTPGVWLIIFWIVISTINLIGVRGYAEFEFAATLIKVMTVTGLIIALIVIDCGGSPSNKYLGAGTYHNPGATKNYFKGFCSVFTGVAFAFAGTELVGLAAAETKQPRKVLPRACKQVIFRITMFYLVSLFLVGLVVPHDDARLSNGSNSYDPSTSPFVIALEIGKIKILAHIVNAVIILSTLSVANSSVFASSRTLLALAEQGFAPKCFTYVDRCGRPLPAAILSLLFGLLSFLIYSSNEGTVFSWLLQISGLSALFAWGSICACHIRFRAAWIRQGNNIHALPWTSPLGTYGSVFGFVLALIILVACIYVSAFPINEASLSSRDRAKTFFNGMISLIIVAFTFMLYKFFARTKFVHLDEMDVTTGRREIDSEEIFEQERAESHARPLWKKVLSSIF